MRGTTTTQTDKLGDRILEVIKQSLQREAEEIFEKAKNEAVRELDFKKDQIIASIGVQVSRHISVQTLGETIRIEVKTEDIKL